MAQDVLSCECASAPRIVVVDYHKGNIRSVERALAQCGAQVVVSDDPQAVANASAVVLPGVGAFTDAMETLDELGLSQALRDVADAGVPFLGICLGQHLLFEAGEEHAEGDSLTEGLGILPGVVRRMPRTDAQGVPFKVPHVGWNRVRFTGDDGGLLDGVEDGSFLYFTHSYVAPDSFATIGVTEHSVAFPSVVRKGNAFGVQFHPEKSSDVGLSIINNFVKIAGAA